MAKPLNPILYRCLQQRFGHVRITNAGQKLDSYYTVDPLTHRDIKMIVTSGEHYIVCCPRCNDTRFRLYINHQWGVRDEKGRQNLWLAICHNENCFGEERARDELFEDVFAFGVPPRQPDLGVGVVVEMKDRVMTMPGPTFTLDTLPPEHPANQYLAVRGYNPERLGRFYGVGYCANSIYYLACHRIIVPITLDGKLQGWQARYIGERDWHNDKSVPKWWTAPGTPRTKLLYNWDHAVRYQTGVIMEGAGDVWSFGPMGVACFGSVMTKIQQQMFVAEFGQRSGVLLLDPDLLKKLSTSEALDKLYGELKTAMPSLAKVILPEADKDPGDYERSYLRWYVANEAKKQGVVVSWKLRA